MSKKIPELNLVPGGVLASNLFFEVARQISANTYNGESERIAADTLIALLTNAGAAVSINLISTLTPTNAAWDSTRTYTPYDYLDIAYQGKHYVYSPAKQPSAGHLPTEAAYWILIASDGAVGAVGPAGPAGQSITGPAGPAGTPGTAGTNGTNGISAIATTTGTPPAIPAVGSSADYVVNSTAGLIAQHPYGFDGITGTLQITAIPNTTTVTLQNVDVTPGATVAAGVKLAPVGKTGAAGTGGGGASGIQYLYGTTPGSGTISAADPSTATILTINSTDATTPTGKNTVTVLGRLKVGAIFEVKKDASNYVRYVVSADYASGSVGVTVDAFAGTIANSDTVYLSIVSDAPTTGSGSGGTSFSGGAISASGAGDSITLSEITAPSGAVWIPYLFSWYRGISAGFSLANGTLLSNSGSSITDNALTTGIYYYRRITSDQVGNKSPSNEVSASAVTVSFESETIAGINAVESTGVTLSTPQKVAADNFIKALKSSAVLSKILDLNLFLGGTAAAHAVNWKTPGNNITWNGLSHSVNGVTGNGSSANYGLTFSGPQNFSSQNSGAIGVYIKSFTGFSRILWAGSDPGYVTGIQALNVPAIGFDVSGDGNQGNNALSALGSLITSRTSSTVQKLFKNGSLAQAENKTSSGLPAATKFGIGISTYNSTNTILNTNPLNGTICSVVIFNQGLTDAEANAYTNADLAYQTALGRN